MPELQANFPYGHKATGWHLSSCLKLTSYVTANWKRGGSTSWAHYPPGWAGWFMMGIGLVKAACDNLGSRTDCDLASLQSLQSHLAIRVLSPSNLNLGTGSKWADCVKFLWTMVIPNSFFFFFSHAAWNIEYCHSMYWLTAFLGSDGHRGFNRRPSNRTLHCWKDALCLLARWWPSVLFVLGLQDVPCAFARILARMPQSSARSPISTQMCKSQRHSPRQESRKEHRKQADTVDTRGTRHKTRWFHEQMRNKTSWDWLRWLQKILRFTLEALAAGVIPAIPWIRCHQRIVPYLTRSSVPRTIRERTESLRFVLWYDNVQLISSPAHDGLLNCYGTPWSCLIYLSIYLYIYICHIHQHWVYQISQGLQVPNSKRWGGSLPKDGLR